jgi:hypothetical protein
MRRFFAAVKRVYRGAKFTHPPESLRSSGAGNYGEGNDSRRFRGNKRYSVAEEALLTAQMMGNRAEHLYDVGVAGIHGFWNIEKS